MRISQAPVDQFNPTAYLIVEYADKAEAILWHNTFLTWCNLNCKSRFSISPCTDPKWGVILTQHLIGFNDPDEAMLFRLAF